MQKKIDTMRTDEARAEINRVVNEVETKLQEQSDAANVCGTQGGSFRVCELKAKFAFLKASGLCGISRRRGRLAREYEAAGLRWNSPDHGPLIFCS